MNTRTIKAGSTDQSITLRIIDDTDGTPETGVVWNTSGIDLWYRREGAVSTDITEATLAALTTAHADGGFLHINDGVYRFDLPDAAVADGVTGVQIGGIVTGMVVLGPYIELVDYDPYDTVRLGLTALPDAAADAALGLPISDAGGLDLDALNTAAVRLTAARAQVLDDWINAGRLDAILDLAATAASLATAQTDLDTLTGTDGATLATSQPNYAPNTTTPPTSAAVADAVWDEAATGHTEAGKAGEQQWTDIDAILADTNELQVDNVPGLIAALNDLSAAQINAEVDTAFTTQMADSVPADGTIATREQAIYMILQFLSDFAISGTTLTVRKVDGSTGLMTFTLDDGTNPTSLTRAT